jgi:hypothetical protein
MNKRKRQSFIVIPQSDALYAETAIGKVRELKQKWCCNEEISR